MRRDPKIVETEVLTQRELERLIERKHAPGIAYRVVSADAVLFEGAVGTVDASSGRPVALDTLFMAYSVTKALTAIAVLRLAEQGALSLDAPLSAYLPEHPYGRGITLRMLLAHTAGVPNPMPFDWFYVEGEQIDRAAALARVLKRSGKLAFEPGTGYRYSNVGYWLLERAIEAATGRPFATVVHEAVFAPLQLDEGATFTLPPAGSLATGHARRRALTTAAFFLLTPSRYWSTPAGGWSRFERLVPHGLGYGGLYASARSLSVVLQDLLRPGGRLLDDASKAALFSPQTLPSGKPTGAALGWVVGTLEGVRYFGKQGGGLGFHGNIRIYPEADVATVYLANSTRVSPGPIDAVSDTLDRAFLGPGGMR